jgi:hypothetical protein
MDLRTYIERHGDRLSKSHPELVRLAKATGLSAYTLYIVALGHKKLSLRKALEVITHTDSCVDGASICDGYPAAIKLQQAPARKVG